MWPFKSKSRRVFPIPESISSLKEVFDSNSNMPIMVVRHEDFNRLEADPLHIEFGTIIFGCFILSKKSKCRNVNFR